MHISEGILEPEILIAGAVVSAAVIIYALKNLKSEDIPKVSAFSALFFVASSVYVPIGPSSVHLILSGIVGAALGIQAFTAIFVALLLQGLLLGYGGMTTLGVNLFDLATPALIASWLFSFRVHKEWRKNALWFAVGFVPVALGAVLLSAVLALNGALIPGDKGDGFFVSAAAALFAHIPVMIVEGVITLLALRFIEKVKPEILYKRNS
ncbi:MAG: cobalt transporter CbiM [Campylobacteraceae bacterium]|jgi:cobalt/nickel transport system permease protein|nr:cobalt transporter CbiM [Campylobacteraceae bacterium]